MNKETLKAGGIDYEEGLDHFSGNKQLYEKYLNRFLELTLFDEMKERIEEGDLKEAFECAHKLKSFVGNLSIPGLYAEIEELTENLRNRDSLDYDSRIKKINDDYRAVCRAIRSGNNG